MRVGVTSARGNEIGHISAYRAEDLSIGEEQRWRRLDHRTGGGVPRILRRESDIKEPFKEYYLYIYLFIIKRTYLNI